MTKIQETNNQGIDILWATLIDIKEAEAYAIYESNFNIGKPWWLRSPGDDPEYVHCVNDDGTIDDYGHIIIDKNIGVRPALIINLTTIPRMKSEDAYFDYRDSETFLTINNKFKFGNYIWTIISDTYALCDDIIGYHCFDYDDEYTDGHRDYQASDIKRYVENWFKTTKEKDNTVTVMPYPYN